MEYPESHFPIKLSTYGTPYRYQSPTSRDIGFQIHAKKQQRTEQKQLQLALTAIATQ